MVLAYCASIHLKPRTVTSQWLPVLCRTKEWFTQENAGKSQALRYKIGCGITPDGSAHYIPGTNLRSLPGQAQAAQTHRRVLRDRGGRPRCLEVLEAPRSEERRVGEE